MSVQTAAARPGIVFTLGRAVLRPWLWLRFRPLVTGSEHVPDDGSVQLVSNHLASLDTILIPSFSPRKVQFLAKASLFKVPVLGWVLRTSGQIPVERSGSSGHQALRAAESLVEHGRMVIVYPEGSLTRDPELWPMRGKTGAVRIALERGIPLVPVAHWGTQALMPRYGKKVHLFGRKKTIDVIVGEPVDLSAYEGKPLDQSTLTAATAELMDAIAALLAELRGEPAPAERWDPVVHGQKETGRLEEQ